ncbi:MAG: hypothetical protein ACLVKO_03445 [Dysgonomonas sp.]
MACVKKVILLLLFSLMLNFGASASPTSFLPMEDEYFSVRKPVYGASIDNIKPYKQPIASLDAEKTTLGYDFGSKDILVCILLFGVYFFFVRKRSGTRNADF